MALPTPCLVFLVSIPLFLATFYAWKLIAQLPLHATVKSGGREEQRRLFKRDGDSMSIEEWEDQSNDYAGSFSDKLYQWQARLTHSPAFIIVDEAGNTVPVLGQISEANFGLSAGLILANFLGFLAIYCCRRGSIKAAAMSGGPTIVYAPTILMQPNGPSFGSSGPSRENSNDKKGNVAPSNTLQAGAMKKGQDEPLPPPPPYSVFPEQASSFGGSTYNMRS